MFTVMEWFQKGCSLSLVVFAMKTRKLLSELWYISLRETNPQEKIFLPCKNTVLNLEKECRILSGNMTKSVNKQKKTKKFYGVTGCHENCKLFYDFWSSMNSGSLFHGLNSALPKNPRKVTPLEPPHSGKW